MQESSEKAARVPQAVVLPTLASPTAFTAIAPPPRLLLLNSVKRVGRESATAPLSGAAAAAAAAAAVIGGGGGGGGGYGGGAVAAGVAASAGSPMAAGAPPLVRSPHVVALDEYLAWLGNTYYTSQEAGMACGQWALLRRTTLGRLTSPARESSPLDNWTPLEVAKFESALCLVGKQFPLVAKVIGTKSSKEVIEFYYTWKQSKNYAVWKESL
jgi:hypothetical protein